MCVKLPTPTPELHREISSVESTRLTNKIITVSWKYWQHTYHFNYIVQILLAFSQRHTHTDIISHTRLALANVYFSQILNGTRGILCSTPLHLLLQSYCWESSGIWLSFLVTWKESRVGNRTFQMTHSVWSHSEYFPVGICPLGSAYLCKLKDDAPETHRRNELCVWSEITFNMNLNERNVSCVRTEAACCFCNRAFVIVPLPGTPPANSHTHLIKPSIENVFVERKMILHTHKKDTFADNSWVFVFPLRAALTQTQIESVFFGL